MIFAKCVSVKWIIYGIPLFPLTRKSVGATDESKTHKTSRFFKQPVVNFVLATAFFIFRWLFFPPISWFAWICETFGRWPYWIDSAASWNHPPRFTFSIQPNSDQKRKTCEKGKALERLPDWYRPMSWVHSVTWLQNFSVATCLSLWSL